MKYLLAHDLGTSGNKATLFSEEGKLIASITSPYTTHYYNGNWAEQDPDDWWEAVCKTTSELIKAIDPADIAGIALSGQMMGCLCVNKEGTPLHPSIIYCDQRASEQEQFLRDNMDSSAFYRITGHRISASYSIEKLMWLRDNKPEVYNNTYKMLNAKDYINFKLTGVMATDHSDASGTNAFDLQQGIWSQKIIETAGVNPDMFPDVRLSIDIIGGITPEAAEATGLTSNTPVATGGGDGSCAGVGVGCVKPGTAYNYLGSSSWIALTVKEPIVDEQMRTMNWAHVVPGYLHPSGTMQTAGASHQWLKNTICKYEDAILVEKGCSPYDLIDKQAEESIPGSNGLLFLPYLLGERTPRWNPDAKGAFIGLTLAHKRSDILRSVIEGITYNLATIVNIFRNHVPIETITVIGGGAKSELWNQMMADIYNTTIEIPSYPEEATSIGAAVIAGVGTGIFENFDVVNRFIKITHTYAPDPNRHAKYMKMMDIFEKSYHALIDVYTDLSKVKLECQ